MSDRVIVVGGGVIGLACAWELAAAGAVVTVLDAAPEAREASWAAAGMLAPHHECVGDSPLWQLGVASLRRWPAFAAAVAGDPARLDHRDAGGWTPAVDAAERAALRHRRDLLAGLGIDACWIEPGELRAREPALAGDGHGALLLPGGHVDPRRLLTVLHDACRISGVDVRYGVAATAIAADGVVAAGTHLAADTVVLASGAWTPALARLSGLALPGEPVKGQLLRLHAADGLLHAFVHHHHAYLVPRAGAGVVVGATMVDSGFDKAEDAAAIAALAAGARRLVPALADAPIVETWTGLRPRLAGGLPVIARAPSGVIVATGHFRNGILLTPITAAAVAALALGRETPCDLAAFVWPAASIA